MTAGPRHRLIECILPGPVAAAEAFEDDPGVSLFPDEHAVVTRAAETRRCEFITARMCAHKALAKLGVPPVPVIPGPQGAPRWPAGVVGSITHCDGYRAAAVARAAEVMSLGIDAEPNESLPEGGMLRTIARAEERMRLSDLAIRMPGICWDRLLFSAKESVYKAWFPLVQRWLGFESADVVFDVAEGTFAARLLVPGPLVAGAPLTSMAGRWMSGQGLLLTAVVIPAGPGPSGAGSICRSARGRSG